MKTNIGSIAYGKFKIHLRCSDSKEVGKYSPSDEIGVNGAINTSGTPIFFEVDLSINIQLISGEKVKKEDLQKAVYVPRKRKLDEAAS